MAKSNYKIMKVIVKERNSVHMYRDAQDCVGELLLKNDSAEQMNEIIERMDNYVQVMVN
jgi:hypothetical protein